MERYTKKDAVGKYYIESANGRLESDKYGHTYGEAIERFAKLENADVAPRAEVAEKIFWEIDKLLTVVYTDDEDGRKFIGVDMQKYYALKNEIYGGCKQ